MRPRKHTYPESTQVLDSFHERVMGPVETEETIRAANIEAFCAHRRKQERAR